jgi:hypothetical protein
MWTGLVWLRIGTSGELLWIRYWTFGFHKMPGNYRVSKQLGISGVALSSMELVRYQQVSSRENASELHVGGTRYESHQRHRLSCGFSWFNSVLQNMEQSVQRRKVGVTARLFSFLRCPGRLWGPSSLLFGGYRGHFPQEGKAWILPLTPFTVKNTWIYTSAPPYVFIA